MRKFFQLALIVFSIFLLFISCEISSKSPTFHKHKLSNSVIRANVKNNGQKPHLVACIVNQDDQYMKMLQLGMSDAAQKEGVNVILSNAYSKLDKEIELINTYLKSGVDGICIHPVSVELSPPILKKAQESGIKVMMAGIKIDDSFNIGCIESDQWELGKKTGELCRDFIQTKLHGKANIALLNYTSQFTEESMKRTDGFLSEVRSLPGVKILTEQEAWLSDIAIQKARNIINSYPSVNILWAANEGGTLGATIAVKNAGKAGKLYVFGTDANEQLLNQLQSKDNILQCITAQQPYFIGYQSMEQLINSKNFDQTSQKIIIPGISLSRTKPLELKNFIKNFNKMIDGD